MLNYILIIFGKLFSCLTKLFNLGNGSTWPGHIALKVNKHFVRDLLKQSQTKTILIAGTNGKTTTAKLIQTALSENGKKVLQNDSGANLLNGIASTLLLNTKLTNVILSEAQRSLESDASRVMTLWEKNLLRSFGFKPQDDKRYLPYDFAIFEIDENALPHFLKQATPDYLILLNLFRDQLDRYGEVNTITTNWKTVIDKLPEKTTMILNADDPQIAYLGLAHPVISNKVRDLNNKKISLPILYFGLQSSQFGNEKLQHAADSVYCPKCGEKLTFTAIAFSHLGDWHCKECGLKRPEIGKESFAIYPLPGLYNKYNVRAAITLLKEIGIPEEKINDAFTNFKPAFGRQEIITYKNKQVQVFLSKNPTSFNQSYTTIRDLGGKILLLVLNDRIPDGRDVSWIWDVDLPDLKNFKQIIIAGDRAYDMALRIKYEDYKNFQTFENLTEAIEEGVKQTANEETFFILPTYSAMLDVRKVLTGKKIL